MLLAAAATGASAAAVSMGTRPAASLIAGHGTTFNVADYGAIGDGTDETSKIQSAIDAAAAGGGGGTVYFPSSPTGRPYTVSTLLMADRVGLVGEHPLVTIKKATGTGGPVIANRASKLGGHSSFFRCLTIDGNYYADAGTSRGRGTLNCPNGTDGVGQLPGSGYTGYWGDGLIVDTVRVLNCGRHGLNVGDSSGTDPTYLVRFVDVRSTFNAGRGVVLSTVWDSWVQGGWIAENVAGNILATGSVKTRFTGVQFEGNDSRVVTGDGPRPALELNNAMWDVVHGCSFTTHRGALVVTGSVSSLTIADCTFSGGNSDGDAGTYHAIAFDAGGAVQQAISIHDNVFEDDAAQGAVAYHLHFADPKAGGAFHDVAVRNNLHRGTIGTCPTDGLIRDPSSGFAAMATRTAVGGSYLYREQFNTVNGIPTPVTFQSEVADYADQHDGARNPELITIARSGPYIISASTGWPDGLTGDRYLEVRRYVQAQGNAATVIAAAKGAPDAAGRSAQSTTVSLRLNAGDSIALVLFQQTGATVTAINCSLSIVPCT